jgi:hypothetical protein
MTDELAEALVTLFERLGPYLQSDPQLRDAIVGIGRAITVWADQVAPTAPQLARPAEPARPAIPVPPPPPVVIPPDFSLGRTPAPVRPPIFLEEDDRGVVPTDLTIIGRRCHLKAEACRLVAARKRGDLPDSTPEDLIRRAGALPDCDLWMLHPGD